MQRAAIRSLGAVHFGLVCLLTASLWGAGAVHDRPAARRAFTQAQEFLRKLQARPASERSPGDYTRAVYLFRLVLDHDPTYGASDDALFEIGRLYEQKLDRFGQERDRERALHHYGFLVREYPGTPHRKAAREAMSRLSAIPSPARIEAGPSESSRDLAREETPPRDSVEKPGPASLERIRFWSGPEYTRVVIDLDRVVRFDQKTLHNPYRVYFDLDSTQLKSGLGKTYEVNDVLIESVRVAQNRPGIVRVVLDYARRGETTIFALYSPYRIVIDTRANLPKPAPGSKPKPSRQVTAEIPVSAGTDSTHSSRETPAPPSPTERGDLTLTRTLGLKVGRIAIDPGHGGHDTGSVGRGGLREKDLVLDVSKRLKRLLEERLGTEVILTRDKDAFVPLEARTAIANQRGADLFVSIHANASRIRKVRGTETFFLSFASTADEREVASRENASSLRNVRELESLLRRITKGDYVQESRDLAKTVQAKLHAGIKQQRSKTRDRGVKKAPFIVLVGTNMPSILTEVGFLTNPDEEKFLRRGESRQILAEALFEGILQYLQSLNGTAALRLRE